MDSLRPQTAVSGTQGPNEKQDQRRSLLVNLLEQHFWRCYLVLVTVLAALVVFAATTGGLVPLWAALGTGITGVLALRHRKQPDRRLLQTSQGC